MKQAIKENRQEQVGDRIKKLRMEKRLSQEDLARMSGLSQHVYSTIERGANYQDKTLVKMAEALDEPIKLNPYTSNKKSVVLFYAVYLIGKSEHEILDDSILQKILKDGIPNLVGGEFSVDKKIENDLKKIIMDDDNYSDVLEKGAEKVRKWY